MITTTTVDLLNHGEIERGDIFCGSTDIPVSDLGWMQMEDSLDDSEWDSIISSPLERCSEFAESVAESVGELILDENFKEIHYGQWEGKTPNDIMENEGNLLKTWWKSPTLTTPPGAEDFYDFRSRVLKAWKELLEEHQGERVLLVTHAGVIRMILMQVLGMHEDNLFRLDVSYGTLSRILIHQDEKGQWSCLMRHG